MPGAHVHGGVIKPIQSHKEHQEAHLKILQEFRQEIKKGLNTMNTASLTAVVDAIRHSNAVDDRKLLLEHALAIVSRIPPGPISDFIRQSIVKLLYNDLSHPASTCISNEYAWRSADGSNNNVDLPNFGKVSQKFASHGTDIRIYTPGWPTVLSFRPANQSIAQ
jgi:hypothetical protein